MRDRQLEKWVMETATLSTKYQLILLADARSEHARRDHAGVVVAFLHALVVVGVGVDLEGIETHTAGEVRHGAKIADLGFISHYFVRLADGQEVLAYRLNGVEGEAMDRFDEGQKVYLWWDEQDARAFAAGMDTQTAGTPANGPA